MDSIFSARIFFELSLLIDLMTTTDEKMAFMRMKFAFRFFWPAVFLSMREFWASSWKERFEVSL